MSLNTLFSLLAFKRRPPLKSIHTMQDAYEFIRNHFLTQEVRASTDGGLCKYRTANGQMCAVGCLISDDNYKPKLEGNSAQTNAVLDAVAASTSLDVGNNDLLAFLTNAQSIHDTAHTDNQLIDAVPKLDELAARYGLDVITT